MNEVVCFETGERFPSQAAAARAAGVSPKSISAAIASGRRSGGWHWFRVSDGIPDPESLTSRGAACIRCVETGEVYRGVSAAQRATGVSASAIKHALNRTAGGYHWIYAHERGGSVASVHS